jgi:hypothetical protein
MTGGPNAGHYDAYNLLAGIEKEYGLSRIGHATSPPITLP